MRGTLRRSGLRESPECALPASRLTAKPMDLVGDLLRVADKPHVLVRLLHEDKRRPRHDRRARAHERDTDVLHLTLAPAPPRLQRALDDVPEPVDASGAETPAERIQRQ